ncbi:hypothetical protein GN244_ATG18258 [Phytophthora infestans]|uniref:Uncharacterized protein n=1 Tax=Phytophthora infestans TaxID=4787 RepID=A0A833S957_PHYIN|nr:hypothetical protein GN244_ATG18258 [Phytophthora infestans]
MVYHWPPVFRKGFAAKHTRALYLLCCSAIMHFVVVDAGSSSVYGILSSSRRKFPRREGGLVANSPLQCALMPSSVC